LLTVFLGLKSKDFVFEIFDVQELFSGQACIDVTYAFFVVAVVDLG